MRITTDFLPDLIYSIIPDVRLRMRLPSLMAIHYSSYYFDDCLTMKQLERIPLGTAHSTDEDDDG